MCENVVPMNVRRGHQIPWVHVTCSCESCYMGNWTLDLSWEKATTVLDHWAIFPTQKQTFLSELTDLGQVTNLSVNGGKTQWPTSLKIQTVSFCFPNNKHWLQCWKVTCHQLSRWPTGKLHPVTPPYSRKKETLCLQRIMREATVFSQGVRSQGGS